MDEGGHQSTPFCLHPATRQKEIPKYGEEEGGVKGDNLQYPKKIQ